MLKYISPVGIQTSLTKMQYPRETFRVNVGKDEIIEFTSFTGVKSRLHGEKIVPLILDVIDTSVDGNIEILERRMKTIRHPKVRNAFLHDGFIYMCVVDKMLTTDIIELSQSFRINSIDTILTRISQKYLFPFIVGDSTGIHMQLCVGGLTQRYDREKLPIYNPRVKNNLMCIQ